MEPEEQVDCHVCFIKPLKLFSYSQIIKCTGCQTTCHKSCYMPSLEGIDFQCDLCSQSKKSNTKCFICGNKGLLKKIGDNFAHPICILFSQSAMVNSYSTLSFHFLNNEPKQKRGKKQHCQICKKPGNLEKCFASCSKLVHMYCAWKSYQTSDTDGWNHNPIVRDYSYKKYFDSRVKVYIEDFGSEIKKLYVSNQKITAQKSRQFQIACPDDIDKVFECCTKESYFHQENIEYIQCDQCFKWYHKKCLDKNKKSFSKKQNQQFTCSGCLSFQKFIHSPIKDELNIPKLPRLNICEMIYLQYRFQQRYYELNPKEIKLLFQMPIPPSLIYVQMKLTQSIEQKLDDLSLKELCEFNLSNRMQRKRFKQRFQQKVLIIIQLYTRTKNLKQLKQHQEGSSQQNQSQSNIQQQQIKDYNTWIQLLQNLKKQNNHFDQHIKKLVSKLKIRIKDIERSKFKKQQQSSQSGESFYDGGNFTSQSLSSKQAKLQSQKISINNNNNNKIKIQKISQKYSQLVKLQPSFYQESTSKHKDFEVDKSQQSSIILQSDQKQISRHHHYGRQDEKQHSQQEQQREQDHQEEQQQQYEYEEQQINQLFNENDAILRPDKLALFNNVLNLPQLKKIEDNVIAIIDYVRSASIKPGFNRKKLEKVYTQQSGYTQLNLSIYLQKGISTHKILRMLQMQYLIVKINKKMINVKHYLQKELKHQQQPLDFLQQNSASKSPLQIAKQKRFIQLQLFNSQTIQKQLQCIRYVINILICFYQIGTIQMKIIFKCKFQTLMKLFTELNDFYQHLKPDTPTLSQVIKQILSIREISGGQQWKNLAHKISTLQQKDQFINLRVLMEKKKTIQAIKKVPFTLSKSSSMQKQYEQFCQSSSENMSNFKRHILRKQCLDYQTKIIKYWITIFGLLNELSINLLTIRLNLTDSSQTQSENKINQPKQEQLYKQPTDVIQEELNRGFVLQTFKQFLQFFTKLRQTFINYKIFHPSLKNLLQQSALKCIEYSFQNISIWGQQQKYFTTMKSLYLKYTKSYIQSIPKQQEATQLQKFNKIDNLFKSDQLYEEQLQSQKILLCKNPIYTYFILTKKLPFLFKFYQQNQIMCRVKTMSTLNTWIKNYFLILKRVSYDDFVSNQFRIQNLRSQFAGQTKVSYNQLVILVSYSKKILFPKNEFAKKLSQIYDQAFIVETQIQKYFDKSTFYINKSYNQKAEYFANKNINIDSINYDLTDYNEKQLYSTQQFENLLHIVAKSQICKIVNFEHQKTQILQNRMGFIQQINYAEQIIQNNDLSISVKKLNQLFFDIISFPFYYKNFKVLYSFIQKRSERQILITSLKDKKQKTKRQLIKKIKTEYNNIIDHLQHKNNQFFTRQKIQQQLKAIQKIDGYKQFNSQQILLKLRQKINQKIYNFDKVYNAFQPILVKYNQNKLIPHNEIMSIQQHLIMYRQQSLCSREIEILSYNFTLYKDIFSKFPQDKKTAGNVLQQLKTLKKSFHTQEFQKRRSQLERRIKKMS